MFFDHLSPEVLTSLGALVVALVVASIVVSRKDPNTESGLELRLRVQTWWWIVGLFALALALDQTIAILFFAFVSFLALKEYLSLIPTRRADRRVRRRSGRSQSRPTTSRAGSSVARGGTSARSSKRRART